MKKALIGTGIAAGICLFGLVVFYFGWVSFVDNYQLGFIYNRFTGKIEPLDRTGYFVFMPYKYSVHAIDLRPYQIAITAHFGISSRVLNAKLVKFNPDGLTTFVAWHGRDAGDNLGNLQEIMKCYAFDKDDGRDCPFITVLSEIAPNQTPSQTAHIAEGK